MHWCVIMSYWDEVSTALVDDLSTHFCTHKLHNGTIFRRIGFPAASSDKRIAQLYYMFLT